MAVQWMDVSIPMKAGMTVWPGDPAFAFDPKGRIAQGASCNTSLVQMSTHTGTHVDAPWHFEDTGKRLDAVDPAIFFGEARLIDLPDVDRITAADLPDEPLPPPGVVQDTELESARRRPVQQGLRRCGA